MAVMLASLTNDVYHYTGADIGIYSILDQGMMRLGPYESTNDPQESRQKFPSLSSHASITAAEAEISQIWAQADWWLRRYVKVACFTQDFELSDSAVDQDALRGWAHPALWAHYAGRHSGVCLRFDRAKLIEQFQAQLGSRGQCFHGAVQYPGQRFSSIPTADLDVGQVLEFGIDAVVSRYIEKNHQDLFFAKHHDWTNENEFRLILCEPSLLPAYLSIGDCLTGIFLGDTFPPARLDAVQHLLERMPDVEFVQLHYQNGKLLCLPARTIAGESPVMARRTGPLADRLEELRSLELQRERARARGEDLTTGIAAIVANTISTVQAACATWPGVEAAVYRRIRAVPPEERGRRPGIPGEVVEFETGWMCVVENLPKYSSTLVIALAIQLLEHQAVKLHASIELETRSPGASNGISELWRAHHETTLDHATAAIETLVEEMDAQLQVAKQEFDTSRSA